MSTEIKRNTKQRQLVIDALASCADFITSQQLHRNMESAGITIGLATVYRTLQTLAAEDRADQLRLPDGELGYRICSPRHHHHLTCRECGATLEISAERIERWVDSIAEEHDFTDLDHVVEIIGVCLPCQKSHAAVE
jgi:Fur family ferric uptake transcriptional regulator